MKSSGYKKQKIARLGRKIYKRAKNYLRLPGNYSNFPSWADKKLFYNLSHGKNGAGEILNIHIKTAGEQPVFLRNNTIDAAIVSCVFFKQYHLPPKKLKPGAVIADLGSNIGLTMRHLKYLYPASTILGVELDHENCMLARKNLAGIDGCILVNAAVWYTDGLVNYTGDNSISFHCRDIDMVSGNSVRSFSLTTLFKEYDLPQIDFVKMDIEGAESVIFDHDCSWLAAVQSINLEVHNGESLHKYISVLQRYGFTCTVSKKHWAAVLAYK
jgi:FkbM family methyltransferase